MDVALHPLEDRLVRVKHVSWNLEWQLQYPETVTASRGEIMAWPLNCNPEWVPLENGGWGYHWRSTREYGQAVKAMDFRDTEGNPEHRDFLSDVAIDAEISPVEAGIRLRLSIHNESETALEDVLCDGGCFQARNPAFAGEGEVSRSSVMVDSRMTAMTALSRTMAIRCMYHHHLERYNPRYDWFWGRSKTPIDHPAIVGMESIDGQKALVFGYQKADSALANSDEHHCLHSRPRFGTIDPGQTVRRTGYILFGTDVATLADSLQDRLNSESL